MEGGTGEKAVTVRLRSEWLDRVRIKVTDNGVGITAENLTMILTHGFTTRKGGHGFGLYSGALAASSILNPRGRLVDNASELSPQAP